jgi:hypothetical protein
MEFGNVYAAGALDPAGIVRKAIDGRLGDHQFDTIVGSGLSGALVIPTLAQAFGVTWAVVRKPEDGSHSSWSIEGVIGERWVFVDDLMDSGKTFRRVHNAVVEAFRGPFDEWGYRQPSHGTRYVGAWLYQQEGTWLDVGATEARADRYGYGHKEGGWKLETGVVTPEVRPEIDPWSNEVSTVTGNVDGVSWT